MFLLLLVKSNLSNWKRITKYSWQIHVFCSGKLTMYCVCYNHVHEMNSVKSTHLKCVRGCNKEKKEPKEAAINHRKQTGSLFHLCVTIATSTCKLKKEKHRKWREEGWNGRFLNSSHSFLRAYKLKLAFPTPFTEWKNWSWLVTSWRQMRLLSYWSPLLHRFWISWTKKKKKKKSYE